MGERDTWWGRGSMRRRGSTTRYGQVGMGWRTRGWVKVIAKGVGTFAFPEVVTEGWVAKRTSFYKWAKRAKTTC